MVKFNQTKRNWRRIAFALSILNAFLLLNGFIQVEAKDKGGDDIILTKGKLIMRGGKGKGNLILDTGKSHESHESHGHHMMPHFNPYSFYPIQHQHHQPQIMIRPVYIEDHSAMHHHQPEQHHYEEPHHYQHHEYHHHQEPQHHEIHHQEPQHHLMHHHEPQHHEMHHEMHHEPHHYEHHEPMHQHYEHGDHHEEEEHHGGYETHPMMQMMMAHGSGLQPNYQQLVAMQALQQPVMYAHQLQAYNQQPQQDTSSKTQMSTSSSEQDQQKSAQPANQQSKHSSLISHATNNPLAAIIKPLFKRNNQSKQKKP